MVYVILDLLVLAGPLALSFDKRVAFYKKWPAVFPAIFGVLLIFGAWDVWKTAIGVWSFSSRYAGSWRFINLPLGEWLFFICVPYACIFILACVRAYIDDHKLVLPRFLWLAMALAFGVAGMLFINKTYTGVVFISVGAVLIIAWLLTPRSLVSCNFWIAILLTYVPFVVANGVLTALPVVLYDNSRNLNIRLGTIPLEDFFFSLSMLILSFSLYDFFGRHAPGPSIRDHRRPVSHAA